MGSTGDRILRLVFMGTAGFAVPSLQALAVGRHPIVAVYAQPARPAGRGLRPRPSTVEAAAERLGLPIRYPASLRAADAQTDFAALGADLAVVAAYGLILPRPILEAPRLGCINLHASLLPRWRGAAPIQRAIMAGDRETGVTIFQIEAALDSGPILAMERISDHVQQYSGDTAGRTLRAGRPDGPAGNRGLVAAGAPGRDPSLSRE